MGGWAVLTMKPNIDVNYSPLVVRRVLVGQSTGMGGESKAVSFWVVLNLSTQRPKLLICCSGKE